MLASYENSPSFVCAYQTMEAFENAITIVMALGGSTNATIHLIAMARVLLALLNSLRPR